MKEPTTIKDEHKQLEDLDDRWHHECGPQSFGVIVAWYRDDDKGAFEEIWRLDVGRLDRPTFERLVRAVGDAVQPFLAVNSLAMKHFGDDSGQEGR